MKTKSKGIVLILLSFLVTIFLASPAAAISASNTAMQKNEETGYGAILMDAADLLTSEEETQLMETLEKVSQYATAIFVTTQESHDLSTVNYGKQTLETICDTLGMDGYTAIIFLIDMSERQLIIYSGETTYKVVTRSIADSITDNVFRYASQGDYYGCAAEAFSQIYQVLNGQKIAQPMRYITAALLAVFAGLGISLILVRVKTKRRDAAYGSIMDALMQREYDADVDRQMVSSKRVRHVEVSGGGGGGGFSGGGGGGGHSGGSSGGGGGGSHSF